MLAASTRMTPKEAGSSRFVSSNAPGGWQVAPASSKGHSLGTAFRSLADRGKNALGADNSERQEHASGKQRFRADVQQAIQDHYGPTFGQELCERVGLTKDHWPTPQQIRQVQTTAKTLHPELVALASHIHEDERLGLSLVLPQLELLSKEQRLQFNAALLRSLTEGRPPEQVRFSEAEALAAAKALMVQPQFRQMFHDAKLATLSAAQQSLQVVAADGRSKTLFGEDLGVDAAAAHRAIQRAYDHYRVQPESLSDTMGAAGVTGDLVDLARQNFAEDLLAPYMAQLTTDTPQRRALAAKLGGAYGPQELDQLLASASDDLKNHASGEIRNLLLGAAAPLERRICARVATDAVASLRTPGPLRDRLKRELGGTLNDVELDKALKRAEKSLRADTPVHALYTLATDPARALARQMKLDLLSPYQADGDPNDALIEKFEGVLSLGYTDTCRQLDNARHHASRKPEELDRLDYAALKKDPSKTLMSMIGDMNKEAAARKQVEDAKIEALRAKQKADAAAASGSGGAAPAPSN
ncbi:hypothetical protein [Peristeroidobacter soli]|uniref:hypothetical protein n=1 Tax=Peristeroidobacter soli TaxID=2497877 RepID=UPI00101DD8D9|nr:hypothetical protein [Peristeroidobacter soli]